MNMINERQSLKQSILSGHPDVNLLQSCNVFSDILEQVNNWNFRLVCKQFNIGDEVFRDPADNKLVYYILQGQLNNSMHNGCQFEYHSLILVATKQTDIITLPKSLYDFILNDIRTKNNKQMSDFLGGIQEFKQISAGGIHDISQYCRIVKFVGNHQVYTAGQIPTVASIIIKGTLIGQLSLQGELVDVKYFQNEQCVGLYQCINMLPMQYSVVADLYSELLQIDRNILLDYDRQIKCNKDNIDIGEIQQQVVKDKKWKQFKQNLLKQYVQHKYN